MTLKLIFGFTVLFISAPCFAAHLTGVWKAQTTVMHVNGTTNQINWTLDIQKQKGPYLIGTSHWTLSDPHGHVSVAGDVTQQASEPFIGVMGQPHKTLYLVETTEHSLIIAHLTGKNSMVVNYVESGSHAVVARAQFKR